MLINREVVSQLLRIKSQTQSYEWKKSVQLVYKKDKNEAFANIKKPDSIKLSNKSHGTSHPRLPFNPGLRRHLGAACIHRDVPF